MVVVTWSRLVPATRDPPETGSDRMRSRIRPFASARVCGPGLAATLAALGDMIHERPPGPAFAAPGSVTCPPCNGRKAMSNAPGSVGILEWDEALTCAGVAP